VADPCAGEESGEYVNDPSIAMTAPVTPLELTPQDRGFRFGWGTLVSAILSIALVVAVVWQMSQLDLPSLKAMLPVSAGFWLTFVAYYMIAPVCEWMMFRRIWNIPWSGIFPLLRKKVYNELLLGYLGEAYFYTWARGRVEMTTAPFGAVKDVAILSAMAGNVATVVLLATIWPLIGVSQLGLDTRVVVWSLGIILVVSLVATFLRKQVFSLGRADLWYIMWMHLARIAITVVLSALLWHLALPAVALMWWFFLATLRLLVSRLPFVPNKDIVFAGLAVFTLGHEQDIGSLMALMAGIIVLAHLVVGAVVILVDLLGTDRKPAA
jgi:hypothetical protein